MNREYRAELAANRQSRTLSENEERQSRIAERNRAAAEAAATLAEADRILADPNSSEQDKQAARAVKLRLKPSISIAPIKPPKKIYSLDRTGNKLQFAGEVEGDAEVRNDPTPPRPSFTFLQTPEGYRPGNTRTGVVGDPVAALAPTADARNEERRSGRVGTMIDAVEELTARINTNQGVMATIRGAAEQQAARVNLQNDIAEYESMVEAFTPIIARAFGHTGVLTQQDVDSARAILPKPTDGKNLRDRKIARLRSLLASFTPSGSPKTDAPPAGGTKPKYELVP
jgi:hypothetical protein